MPSIPSGWRYVPDQATGITIGCFLKLLRFGWVPRRDEDSKLFNSLWALLNIVKARISWGHPAVDDDGTHSGRLRLLTDSLVDETLTFGDSTFKFNPSVCTELILSAAVGEFGTDAVSRQTRLEPVYIYLGHSSKP